MRKHCGFLSTFNTLNEIVYKIKLLKNNNNNVFVVKICRSEKKLQMQWLSTNLERSVLRESVS